MSLLCMCFDSALGAREAVEGIEAQEVQRTPTPMTREGFPKPKSMHALVFGGLRGPKRNDPEVFVSSSPLGLADAIKSDELSISTSACESPREFEYIDDERDLPGDRSARSGYRSTPPNVEGTTTHKVMQDSAPSQGCVGCQRAPLDMSTESKYRAQKNKHAKVPGEGDELSSSASAGRSQVGRAPREQQDAVQIQKIQSAEDANDGHPPLRRMPSNSSVDTTTPSGVCSLASSRCGIVSMSSSLFADSYRIEESATLPSSQSAVPSVRFATRLSDGLAVAIKSRSRSIAFDDDIGAELKWLKEMRSQLEMQKRSRVCELVEVIQMSTQYHVVMEKVEGANLRTWLAGVNRLKPCFTREIVKQILQGLSEMHASQRMHRNLSPKNVMVSIVPDGETTVESQVTVTLISLDAAATWRENAPRESLLVGTQGYMAPEGYQGCLSPASDLYSVGAIMYWVLAHKLAVPTEKLDVKLGEGFVDSKSARRIYNRLREADIDFAASPLSSCPAAASLCRSLLAFQPQERPSAQEALAHEWFTLGDALLEPRA